MIWLTRLFSWTSAASAEPAATPGYVFTASGQSRAFMSLAASFDFTASQRSYELVAIK